VGKNILRKFHIHFPKGTTYDLREGVVSRPGALRTYWTRRKDLVLSSHGVTDQKTPRFFKFCGEESRHNTWMCQETVLYVKECMKRGPVIFATK
jgi:hypothetical protein